MNEPRASRYHRARRRLTAASLLLPAALLGVLALTNASAALRDMTGGRAWAYAAALAVLIETVILPVAWLRTRVVEPRFRLAPPPGPWWTPSLVRMGISAAGAAAAAELLYALIGQWPTWWWVPGAITGGLVAAAATALAPIVMRVVDRPRPLSHAALAERLSALAQRVGIVRVAVQECGATDVGGRTTARLVGAGTTPRVILSAGLVADFPDDEIEVILAHELAHHVHRDLLRTLGAELVVLTAGLWAAGGILRVVAHPLGPTSPADPAGLPIILLVAATVRAAAAPILNVLSRHAERRADRFAIGVVSRPEAFAGAVRRMAARNLAEERPTRAAFWWFHTHPTVEQRIADALAVQRGVPRE